MTSKSWFTGRRIAMMTGTAVLLLLSHWYLRAGEPLSGAEIDDYMATYRYQAERYPVRHDLAALRQFLQEDDGRPFYTVNLYRFHAVADYAEGSAYAGSGADAYDRFSAIMIKLMAARASHPVFGSFWSDENASSWDRLVIVRYRSRRDLADLFATSAFATASEHKWAAIKENERLLVQGVHLPDGVMALGLVAFLVAFFGKVLAAIIHASGRLCRRTM